MRQCHPEWVVHLSWILQGLSTAAKEDSSLSLGEMVYEIALNLLGQFLAFQDPPVKQLIESLQTALSNFQLSPSNVGHFQSKATTIASGTVEGPAHVCLAGK